MLIIADSILISVITLISLIILFIQKYKTNQVTFDNEPNNSHFSTARRDIIKFIFALCQVILFTLLLFLRIFYIRNVNGRDIFHSGSITICWIYCMTLYMLICFVHERWKWTLNFHATSICIAACLCATWQIRIASIFHNDTELIIAILNLVNSIILCIISITTPKGPPVCNKGGRPITSIVYCSIWNFITFSTVIPLIYKSFKKNSLDDSDLDELPNDYTAIELYNKIRQWPSNNLLYRIWKANQNAFLLESFFVIISSFLHYLPILFLYSLLDFLQGDKNDIEWAIFCIFGILIGGLLHTFAISEHQYLGCSVLQSSVSSMLNSEIYSKSLRIKNNVNEIGKISNLMAVDANRISQFMMWWGSIVEAPVQIGIGLFFLYKLINSACLIGILVLIIILPIQRWSGKYFSQNQEKLMIARDYRVSLMNEILQGIRMIKFNAWEGNWITRIMNARNIELKFLKKSFILMSIFNLLWIASPILITTVSFLTYTKIQGNELTASIAFTSVTIFNEIRFLLNDLAELFILALQAIVSLLRIEKFLNSDEYENGKNIIFKNDDKIGFENATITWSKSEEIIEDIFIMKDLNIEFPIEQLSIICGPTGSGKTLLLMALLGETEIPSERYDQVVKSCALDKDFESFMDGDLTEIGDQGVTLSGGQKQRISLARAVYSRAKHILIDDALSAVDTNTANYLVNECISGPLMDKRTRILVTHHLNLTLPIAKYVVMINNGQIVDKGEVSELNSNGLINVPKEIVSENESSNNTSNSPSQASPVKENTLKNTEEIFEKKMVVIEDEKIIINDIIIDDNNNKSRALIEEEEKESGMVKLNVYLKYFKSNGSYLFWIIALILFMSTRAAQTLEGWWLNVWSNLTQNTSQHNVDYYINIYILITMLSVFFGVIQFSWLYYGSLQASKKLYNQMFIRVIKAPLRFFDTTPIGRILNRFSKDFETIDSLLSVDLGLFLHNLLMMVGVVLVITAITKEFAIAAIIFVIIYVSVGILYAKASRELKRLDSITKSPLYSQYTETLIGITTIRAFNITDQFMNKMLTRIDNNIRPFYFLWVANRWLQIWTNGVGAFFPCIAGVLILLNLREIDASLAGYSLSFSMTFTSQIMWSIRKYTQLEMSLNSIERVVEYLNIKQENYHGEIKIKEREDSEKNWPTNGSIKFERLSVKYAENLKCVLHNVSFEINGKERVGIVGRTGSGKSTMSLSLFRFLEATEGKIFIDGIDISKLNLQELRSNLTIIPQDPILFTGTIRSNLDVFSQHTDYEIFETLKRVNLLPLSSKPAKDSSSSSNSTNELVNIFSNLDTQISEEGNNISQGQRQLLCLARALLKKSKIIIMDEATASIDFDMDEKIQRMIRNEFSDCTIICIAHRLQTIIDYDKVLVLDQGRVLEFDSPYNLISNPDSKFYQMCKQSGEFDILKSLALKQS
ncbi:multidrug resistance-associated ABC transporter [Rhizophagus clarus]|uniref:Multidrug resistance-associated ABC transporter n=1 Tax=Rhizophagus clarus TaxID=94130 RepID=A0A8H3LUW1_9GLOM|nr:multidrug resistance-associated ABC transporter [Rhizophagus clarus]